MTFVEALNAVVREYHSAHEIHPVWPTDPIHAAAIVGEEAGELTQAVLDHTYQCLNHHGNDTIERMKKEAVQTGAMALRFLVNLDRYETRDTQKGAPTP